MRRGLTLLEMLVVIVIAGLVGATAVPLIGRLQDHLLLDKSVRELASALAQTRVRAVFHGEVAQLTITADSFQIATVSGGLILPRKSLPGPLASGVLLSGPSHAVQYAPTGLGLGVSNGTWTLSRNGLSRQVIVARYGRVRLN